MSRLLYEILSELEYERLLEEGKDPVELLHHKFKNVPSDVIDKVISLDPTKKKSYSHWVLGKWDDESDLIMACLKNGSMGKLFKHFQRQNAVQLQNFRTLGEVVRDYVPSDDTVLSKSDEDMTYVMNLHEKVDSELANDFDIVYNDGKWLIAVPNTYEAECKLGENMKWCTANAYGNGKSYYEEYLSKGGKYYVNFDLKRGEERNGKEYPYKRYQFHFESNQFMDKNDSPIDPGNIGMPDGAFEYYYSEGYDEDNFMDEEGRMEAYEQDRNSVSFLLSDNGFLNLNIEYDNEDYQFEEPDEDTYFYLYDEEDNIDPICWNQFKNPHTCEDVIVKHRDWFVLLKDVDDSHVFAYYDKESNYTRHWVVFEDIGAYTELPNGIGLALIDSNGYFCVFNETWMYKVEAKRSTLKLIELHVRGYDGEFVYIEGIGVGGTYHSLFRADISKCECIISCDVPKNGEWFVANASGVIEGKFRKYYLNDDEPEDESDLSNYTLVNTLENGDFLVSNGSMLTIIKQGEVKPRFPLFEVYYGNVSNIYVVRFGGVFEFYGMNGERIGGQYEQVFVPDKTGKTICGKITKSPPGGLVIGIDFVDAEECKVFANFPGYLNIPNSDNGIIPVWTVDNKTKIFNTIKKEIVYPEIKVIEPIRRSSNTLICEFEDGSDGKALYNCKKDSIEAVDIKNIESNTYSDSTLHKIEKVNGKWNAYDEEKGVVFENDVDMIRSINYDEKTLVYMLNGRYYPFDCARHLNLINPNGSTMSLWCYNGSSSFGCATENYKLVFLHNFKPEYAKETFIYYGKVNANVGSGIGIDENTPKEIIDAYNAITGQNVQSGQQQQMDSMKENFMRTLKKIDEAFRIIHNI